MARYFTERTAEGETGQVAILTLRTEMLGDLDAASECRHELSHYTPTCNVVVDLDGAPTIESSVIGGVLALHKAARRAGGRLSVCNVGSQVMRLLKATKLDKLLLVASSEEEAVRLVLGQVEN